MRGHRPSKRGGRAARPALLATCRVLGRHHLSTPEARQVSSRRHRHDRQWPLTTSHALVSPPPQSTTWNPNLVTSSSRRMGWPGPNGNRYSLRVFVTVKTYPVPSAGYDELACTARVREDGSFIRLYPIDFRYRSEGQQYQKYQWINVRVTKSRRDPRLESFRPDLESIALPLGTGFSIPSER